MHEGTEEDWKNVGQGDGSMGRGLRSGPTVYHARSFQAKFMEHLFRNFDVVTIFFLPVPVAARSVAWVCCRSPAGVAGSNPFGSMDGWISCVLCVVR